MGTLTVSTGVYRAFRSDQGLVSLAFALRRKNGMEEVVGSIPTRSTNIFNSLQIHAPKTRYAFDTLVLTTHLLQCFRLYPANDSAERRLADSEPRAWQESMPSQPQVRLLPRRIIVQVLPEPSLDFCYRHPLAFVIVSDLIAVNFSKTEIPRFRMGEVEPTHARAGPHGK